MDENNGKRGFLFAIIGVVTLIVAVVGATYAYFSATATSDQYSGKTLSVNLSKPTVELVSNTGQNGQGLIPIYDGTVSGHPTQLPTAVSAAKNCVDKNEYTVCHIYKVTINNTGDDATTIDTSVSLNKGGSTYLKWASMTGANTFGTIQPTLLGDDVDLAGKGSVTQYFVVYLSNTGDNQTTDDSGKTYTGTVTITASTGSQIQAEF